MTKKRQKVKIQFKNDESIGDEMYLWKYLDLHKFISLISSKSLFVTRLDKFEDKREGMTLKHLYFKKIKNVMDNDPIFDSIRKYAKIDSLGNWMNLISTELEEIQKFHFASCWVLCDGYYESAAMWNLYSSPNSIAIKIKYKEFKDLLSTKGFSNEVFAKEIICAPIQYKNFQKTNFIYNKEENELEESVFVKDSSFEHEKEFRLILKETPREIPPIYYKPNITKSHVDKLHNSIYNYPGVSLKFIDFQDYPFEVIHHPKSEDWAKENIKNIIEKFGMSFILKDSALEMK